MKVGIMSDSHGQYDRMKQAIELLRAGGAQQFIHCGDLGSNNMLDLLAGLKASLVWGNCDYSRGLLESYASRLGIHCFGSTGRLEVDGKSLVFMHGDDHRAMSRVLAEQNCDYLCYGHTHAPEDRREGRIRLINPGALYRVGCKTTALLDVAGDALEFIEVPEH